MTRSRIALTIVLLLVLAAGWTAWLGWQAYRGLDRAQDAVTALRTSVDEQDRAGQENAVSDLRAAAADVDGATGGWWWGSLTVLPLVGDDFSAVRAIGSSLDSVASDGIDPLLEVSRGLDGITDRGRLDLEVIERLGAPVSAAATSFTEASDKARDVDADGLVGALQTRFVDYREQIDAAASGLEAGSTAVELLPPMAGRDETRDYLLIFQNNAEVRATGGLPGSWARLNAQDGALQLREQGSWPEFPVADEPVVELTPGEATVFGDGIATYFSNPGYSRDFPRAAEIWEAFWDRRFPTTDLDGVIALDPVALSYLVEGTGPVEVDGVTLTSDTLVEQVLSEPYLALEDPAEQDAFFQAAARSVFTAVTVDLASPTAFVSGLARASQEGRLLVAPFDSDEAAQIVGTTVEGSLTSPDAQTPEMDIGVNDATGSKMSYYLRYDAELDAVSCNDDRQQLAGRLSLRQSISPAAAAELPRYVTGGGFYGTEPGSQLLNVQLYGPVGGDFGVVQLDGEAVQGLTVAEVEGRPVVQLGVLLDSRDDVVVTWSINAAEGQDGDPVLDMTPSVVPGDKGGPIASACGG